MMLCWHVFAKGFSKCGIFYKSAQENRTWALLQYVKTTITRDQTPEHVKSGGHHNAFRVEFPSLSLKCKAMYWVDTCSLLGITNLILEINVTKKKK